MYFVSTRNTWQWIIRIWCRSPCGLRIVANRLWLVSKIINAAATAAPRIDPARQTLHLQRLRIMKALQRTNVSHFFIWSTKNNCAEIFRIRGHTVVGCCVIANPILYISPGRFLENFRKYFLTSCLDAFQVPKSKGLVNEWNN